MSRTTELARATVEQPTAAAYASAMVSANARSFATEQLAAFLLDGVAGGPLSEELSAWLASSPRFRAFASTYRDKIRKKLRGARDVESRLDVRAELCVARLLLADERIALEFEVSGLAGGPDFAVTHRGHALNLEVTRLQRPPEPETIGRVLMAKLRQLPPSAPNVLLLATGTSGADALAIDAAAKALRARADAKDEAFFARHKLAGARGFYDRFLRLGAVLVWAESASADHRAELWVNPSARIEPSPRALRAIQACLRAE